MTSKGNHLSVAGMENPAPALRDLPHITLWVLVPRFLYSRLKIRRGVGRLMMMLAKVVRPLHRLPVPMLDGRTLFLDLRETMSMPYLLEGRIWEEEGETELMRSFVRSGEVAIDIGANMGWFSTLLADAVAGNGKIYAFEPSQRALATLLLTASRYPQLEVVRMALCDKEGEAKLHIPDDGVMASLNPLPGELRTQACPTTTLDSFLARQGNPSVSFIKCDAEGAELAILKGATKLLQGARPPAWIIEINEPTAERAGFKTEDLFDYFSAVPGVGYRFYRIHSQTLEIVPRPIPTAFRYNAVFVPAWQEERIESYRQAWQAKFRSK